MGVRNTSNTLIQVMEDGRQTRKRATPLRHCYHRDAGRTVKIAKKF